MKKTVFLAVTLALLCVMPARAANYNVNGNYDAGGAGAQGDGGSGSSGSAFDDIYGQAGVEGLYEGLPKEAGQYLEQSDTYDITSLSKKLSFGFLADAVLGALGKLLPGLAKGFAPVIALILMCAAAGALKGSILSAELSGSIDFALNVCLAGAAFPLIKGCFDAAKGFIDSLCGFMAAMIPVMGSLYAVSGNVTAAASSSSGLFVILNAIEYIGGALVIPALQVCFALTLAASLGNAVSLGGVAGYVKSTLIWVFGLIMSVATAAVYFRTVIAASADNMAARTVKFAFSSFVPVVGGVLGDATRTVIGSISALKSVAGVFGVLAIFFILVPPLLGALASRLMLKLSGALALILGGERQAAFLSGMASLLDITLAVMIGSSVIFIFIVTVFMKTAVIL